MGGIYESIDPVATIISQTTLAAEYTSQALHNFLRNGPVVLHENIVVEFQSLYGHLGDASEKGVRQSTVVGFGRVPHASVRSVGGRSKRLGGARRKYHGIRS